MPYRIDVRGSDDVLDQLVALGAIDIEAIDGHVAALMPDHVAPDLIADALGVGALTVSPAVGRDDESVWVLAPRALSVGRLQIVPAHLEAEPGALRLVDSVAFGTGLHATTALCLEYLDELVQGAPPPDALLDVGTGSGILALAALAMGVPRAIALDLDADALDAAAGNARLNGFADRLQLVPGGPESVEGMWPLVTANILAAPLIEMAPTLVRRVASRGYLVLSGIPTSVEADVNRAYRRTGMRRLGAKSRGGWVALLLQPSW